MARCLASVPENSFSVGVLTTDAELIVRSWDAWLEQASAIPEHAIRGKPLLDVFPDIEQRGLLIRLQSVLAGGPVEVLAPAFHQYLLPFPTSAGESFFAHMQQHVTIAALRQDTQIDGLVITIEDVTSRSVNERRLSGQLKSQDEVIRLRAAKRLSQMPHDGTPLIPALADDNWQVRRTAASGAAERLNQAGVQQLVDTIRAHHDNIALLNATLTTLIQSHTDPIPQMLPLLQDEEPNIRMYTALALGQMKNRRAVAPLLALLRDQDSNVVYHAVEALGRIRSRDAIEPLLAIVRSRDPFLSFAALDAIAAIGEPYAMNEVLPLLQDDMLLDAAVDALASLGNERAVAPLLATLAKGSDPSRVARALRAINERLESAYSEGELVADLVRRDITPELIQLMVARIATAQDEDLAAIAEVLGWLKQPGIENVLTGLLAHPHARAAAQQALLAFGPAAVDAVRSELRHSDYEVRKAAALILAQLGVAVAAPALIAALADATPEVVIAAALALGGIGDGSAFRALLGLLDHPDAAVRSAAVAAINSIGHPETETEVRKLLSAEQATVRECAVKIAGYFGYRSCFDTVHGMLKDENEGVRHAVTEHLGYFNDERVVPALVEGLASMSPAVRAAAARSLGHVDAERARAPLMQALADVHQRVRFQAINSIANQDLRDLVDDLRELLRNDQSIPVRIAAAQALGQLHDTKSAPLLEQLVDEPEADLACAAIAGLGNLPGPHAENAFIMALSSGEQRRQQAALHAIKQSGMKSLLPYVQRVVTVTPHQAVRQEAMLLLTQQGGRAGIEAVLELAKDAPWAAEALDALSEVPDAQVADLARGLKHPHPRVRWLSVESIARTKRVASSRILGESLTDPDPAVRFAISEALSRLDLL